MGKHPSLQSHFLRPLGTKDRFTQSYDLRISHVMFQPYACAATWSRHDLLAIPRSRPAHFSPCCPTGTRIQVSVRRDARSPARSLTPKSNYCAARPRASKRRPTKPVSTLPARNSGWLRIPLWKAMLVRIPSTTNSSRQRRARLMAAWRSVS
jgi:hypothetical protein